MVLSGKPSSRILKDLRFPELSYASDEDPWLRRSLIQAIEGFFGRDRYLDLYEIWCRDHVGTSPTAMTDLLELLRVDLRIHAKSWPKRSIPDGPLMLVANHPFGIGDGLVALSLAETLERPYRVLINSELLKIPEVRPYALAVDFRENEQALATNLETRRQATEFLRQGGTLVVFPAGGVATAANPFGKAVELPWKLFPARLVQATGATVLPVYFEGQNSLLFHLASRVSMTLRLALLIREFRRFTRSPVDVHIGEFVSYRDLVHLKDRQALSDALYAMVHDFAP